MDTTKEYDGYRMETIPVSPDPPRIPRADEEKKSSSESEEEQPDYYFNQFNLGFNNQADQEEYSEEETNEEYSDEESKEEGHDDAKLDISHDKVIDKNGQPPRKERLDDDSYEVYSDEESAEKPAGVMDKVKGIFSKGIFASLGSFFSGLTGSTRIPYEGDDDMTEEEYDEVTARATTPSGSEKVSKRPKRANPTRNPWAFFQDANFFETDAEKLESMPSVADMNIDALFLNPFDSLNWNFFGEREGTAPR